MVVAEKATNFSLCENREKPCAPTTCFLILLRFSSHVTDFPLKTSHINDRAFSSALSVALPRGPSLYIFTFRSLCARICVYVPCERAGVCVVVRAPRRTRYQVSVGTGYREGEAGGWGRRRGQGRAIWFLWVPDSVCGYRAGSRGSEGPGQVTGPRTGDLVSVGTGAGDGDRVG